MEICKMIGKERSEERNIKSFLKQLLFRYKLTVQELSL